MNDVGIIINTCETATDETCLTDFQKVAQTCDISADQQTNLPLAYDRNQKVCYQGYEEIVTYLDNEEQLNQEAIRAGDAN